jgi:hypothetical protein
MGSKRLDPEQFTILAKQEARLNTAYWLSALIEKKSESLSKKPIKESELKSFERQINLMLKHVRKDIKLQKGTSKDRVKHELKYVKKICRHQIKTSSKRALYTAVGFPVEGDAEILQQEISFVKERCVREDNAILDQRWHVATGIMYDIFYNLNSSRWFTFKSKSYEEQLSRANELYSPFSHLIESECKEFVDQLDLDDFQSQNLEQQLNEDYLEMFSAGRRLLELAVRVLAIQGGFIWRIMNRKKNLQLANAIFEELSPAQERLILSCIAHGNTIRRAIDADVVE